MRPRSDGPRERSRYRPGSRLAEAGTPAASLEGHDAVSLRTGHDPTTRTTQTVTSNTSAGAWPVIEVLEAA